MPPKLTSQDFEQELLFLFDAYVHGSVDRRGFLDGAQHSAEAGVTAAGLLAALSPNFAAGQQVGKDDAQLKTGWIMVPSASGSGSIRGYLVWPASACATRLPAMLVIRGPTRTSKTSRGAGRWTASWPSRPML